MLIFVRDASSSTSPQQFAVVPLLHMSWKLQAGALRVIGGAFAASARSSKGGFVCDTLSKHLTMTVCCVSLLFVLLLLVSHRRADALRVISDAFAAPARPSQGGFVRDALSSTFP
jgi:hypothetical protein